MAFLTPFLNLVADKILNFETKLEKELRYPKFNLYLSKKVKIKIEYGLEGGNHESGA